MRHWNRERRRATARSGFSLVELVAALVIFSGGVLAVLEVTAVCLRSTAASLGYTQAVHLAQRVIEETVAEGGIEVSSERGDFGESYPRHAWQREIEETDQDDLYQLRVVVTWDERGREKRYPLTTLVAYHQTVAVVGVTRP